MNDHVASSKPPSVSLYSLAAGLLCVALALAMNAFIACTSSSIESAESRLVSLIEGDGITEAQEAELRAAVAEAITSRLTAVAAKAIADHDAAVAAGDPNPPSPIPNLSREEAIELALDALIEVARTSGAAKKYAGATRMVAAVFEALQLQRAAAPEQDVLDTLAAVGIEILIGQDPATGVSIDLLRE